MIKRFLLTFLISLPLLTFAQKGVDFKEGCIVQKKTEDTLRGEVCYINTVTGERYEKIYFKDAGGSKKRFGQDRISSFIVDGKNYEYAPLDPNSSFPTVVQRVVAGDIFMYKAWFKTADSTPTKPKYEEAVFLRKKDSEEYFEFFEKNFYKQMKSYFKGDDDIVQLVKDSSYELNDLEKIVVAYNEKD